jgi:hypothetical protein
MCGLLQLRTICGNGEIAYLFTYIRAKIRNYDSHSRTRTHIDRNPYEILQIRSVSVFDKTPINQLLSDFQLDEFDERSPKQLHLFDL